MENMPKLPFFILLEGEFYKATRNKWLLIILLMPAILVLPTFAQLYEKYGEYTQNGLIPYPSDPYPETLYGIFKLYQYTFPLLMALLAGQFFQAEQQSEGLKLYNTLPASRTRVLTTRYWVLLTMPLLSMALAYGLFWCGIYLFETAFPLYSFQAYDVRLSLLVFFSRLTFAACCIMLIQYGLHLVTNNYYLPLLLAFIGLLISYVPLDFIHLNYYNQSGYLYSAYKEFMVHGTSYHWIDGLWMIAPVLLVTAGAFWKNRHF